MTSTKSLTNLETLEVAETIAYAFGDIETARRLEQLADEVREHEGVSDDGEGDE